MKRKLALFLVVLMTAFTVLGASGCSLSDKSERYVVSVEQSTDDDGNGVIRIGYSDGTYTNVAAKDGKDGEDGKDVTIQEVYEEYKKQYGEISFSDFLKAYLTLNADNTAVINDCLRSSVKLYTEFIETAYENTFWNYRSYPKNAMYTGSGVIYSIDDNYTYIVTNYHVVYSASADKLNGGNFAKNVYCYLYGSEGSPERSSTTDSNGLYSYTGGAYGINCELIGGSINCDIAVLRAKTEDVLKINPDATAVTLADTYHVGETAIAIGNPEDGGISVTEGIISVDNEFITLKIDDTTRRYRSIRIDTALYSGNSGGGLFNVNGELIGITNAGNQEDQNINYAIPLDIVTGVVDNLINSYKTSGAVAKINRVTLGVSVSSSESRYRYDEKTGYGSIEEKVTVESVTSDSIAAKMDIKAGDVILSLSINGESYTISRYFNISDIIYRINSGDKISITVERDGNTVECNQYTVLSSDMSTID